MAGTVKFFTATDPFNLADWEIQDGPQPSLATQRAQALKSDGDELNKKQYGGQYSGTCTYTARLAANKTELVVPKAGIVVNGWHIDNWTVTYSQTGFPTLSIQCHKHDTSRGGTADSNCRTYTASFKVPACFGVPATIAPVSGTGNIFALAQGAVVGMRALSLGLSVTHLDEPNAAGEHFASENRDGVETLTAEFTGEADTSDFTLHADWTNDAFAQNGGNTVASTASVSATHHVAHDVATLAPNAETAGGEGEARE